MNIGDCRPRVPVTPAVSATGGSAVWSGSDSQRRPASARRSTSRRAFPVSAYDILPYGGASSFLPSAELLLPTSAWGTNYVTAVPQPTTGPGWGQVVAQADGHTTVQITPKTALAGRHRRRRGTANTTTTYTLNAGQYVQWQNAGDMAGSVIRRTIRSRSPAAPATCARPRPRRPAAAATPAISSCRRSPRSAPSTSRRRTRRAVRTSKRSRSCIASSARPRARR